MPRVGSLHLLQEVRPAANEQVAPAHAACRCGQAVALPDQASKSVSVLLQTLGLPRELFQIVLAKAAQQYGTVSSLRLTCRSLAHGCAAALVTGGKARQALIFPQRGYAVLPCIS